MFLSVKCIEEQQVAKTKIANSELEGMFYEQMKRGSVASGKRHPHRDSAKRAARLDGLNQPEAAETLPRRC